MKAYRVSLGSHEPNGSYHGWTENVIDIHEEGVHEAVKKKFGAEFSCMNSFAYVEISIETVPVKSLTVGELMELIKFCTDSIKTVLFEKYTKKED